MNEYKYYIIEPVNSVDFVCTAYTTNTNLINGYISQFKNKEFIVSCVGLYENDDEFITDNENIKNKKYKLYPCKDLIVTDILMENVMETADYAISHIAEKLSKAVEILLILSAYMQNDINDELFMIKFKYVLRLIVVNNYLYPNEIQNTSIIDMIGANDINDVYDLITEENLFKLIYIKNYFPYDVPF